MLVDRRVPPVPDVFVDGESLFMLETKLQVRQFLGSRYPGDLEKSSAAAPDGVASTDGLAGELEGEADRHLAYFLEVST